MYIIDSDARVALILAIQQPKWKGGSSFFRFFPKKVLRCLGQEIDLKTTFQRQSNIKTTKTSRRMVKKVQNVQNGSRVDHLF